MVAPRALRNEGEPILPDEAVLRRFPVSRRAKNGVIPVAAFKPRPVDSDGLSVYREDCVEQHSDVVAKAGMDPEKVPPAFHVASVPSACVCNGMELHPDAFPPLPGHCLIPQLNSNQDPALQEDFASRLHVGAKYIDCFKVRDGQRHSEAG